ncbi:phage tail terminator family protein [Cytobacillus purgationiresistens]|uniref:Phage protein n=1 Tax=Cytobacillus purgationiresistens TaxID=863449 RepID=A0ABU0AFZ2_9BACI|nr:hypothetical protein [Cytobacillus purgationiresistens]MDQ0269940.1 hypothetical protein [Cytobacillus purgationiresistens]
METELKSLIIRQIKEVYGNEMKVYDEPVRQGLETPSFLVLLIEDQQERKLGYMSEWEFLVNVTYFPHDGYNAYSENDRVSQTFKENFRYIGNVFHVNRLKATKSDGILIISFTVKKQVKEILDGTKMQALQYGGVTSE